MAYENRNAAYDLSLFDDDNSYSWGTEAPKRQEKEVHKKKTAKKAKKVSKVVTLPQDELDKIRRRKHNPLKLIVGGTGGLAVALVIGFIIVGQVQIMELNQEIINAKALLEDCQSVYTQNQMKLEAQLTGAEIEKYAEDVLGMTKVSNAQKEFVTLSGGDKAEVSAQGNQNLFSQFINSVNNLWS